MILHPVFGIRGRFRAYIEISRIQRGGVQCCCVFQFCFLILSVPDRDAVSPPELTADAPVLDVLHPVGVGLAPACRAEGDVACGDGVRGFLDTGVLEEPLHGQARLDRHVGALGEAHIVFVFFHVGQQSLAFENLGGLLAGLKAVHPVELGHVRAVDMTVRRQDVDDRQAMTLSYGEVNLVMGGGDLERAFSKFHIDVFVGDNGDFRFDQRADYFPADQVGEARVLRVDGYGRVSHDGFRTGRSYSQEFVFSHDFVKNGVHPGALRLHDDFFVREGRQGNGTPVYHAPAPVDEAVLEEVDKDAGDFARVVFIHGEALAFPVTGAAQFFQLVDDDVAMFVFPFPDFAQKGIASQIMARLSSCLAEILFHPYLGGYARMVRSGEPEDFVSFLARAAAEDVLQGIVQDMSQMQHSRDIGRRNDNRISGLAG